MDPEQAPDRGYVRGSAKEGNNTAMPALSGLHCDCALTGTHDEETGKCTAEGEFPERGYVLGLVFRAAKRDAGRSRSKDTVSPTQSSRSMSDFDKGATLPVHEDVKMPAGSVETQSIGERRACWSTTLSRLRGEPSCD